ncbi:hypothetical protein PF007_g7520 [Phytophthora fragariae]|uniref:Uncharacterized protein n=1 Tax=Phytophthora fragariae TaxID=53985 RepID=A0A6A3SSS5_9STRA|nr:hypothetical protein PF003_g10877 [Phytophthora fragariae]KAE9122224.1 hypothetical protein PF007_g7520 [Phytophthora fragariae]KAE9153881.1 hypothetical protein PF006_g2023 [Phytophthora fragariae]
MLRPESTTKRTVEKEEEAATKSSVEEEEKEEVAAECSAEKEEAATKSSVEEDKEEEEGVAADSDQVLRPESAAKRSVEEKEEEDAVESSVEEKEEAVTESNPRRRRGGAAADSDRVRSSESTTERSVVGKEEDATESSVEKKEEAATESNPRRSIVVATRLRDGALSEHGSSQKLLAIEGQVENMVNQFWSRTESLAKEYAALQDAHVQGEALLAAQASTQQGVQLLAEHQHVTSLQFQQDLHDTRATLETHLNTLARMQAEHDARMELAVKDRLEALTLQTQQEMSRIRVMVDEMKRAQTERQAAVNRALDALVEQVTAIAVKEREKEGNVERRVREVYESLSGEWYNRIDKKACDVVETRLAASEKRVSAAEQELTEISCNVDKALNAVESRLASHMQSTREKDLLELKRDFVAESDQLCCERMRATQRAMHNHISGVVKQLEKRLLGDMQSRIDNITSAVNQQQLDVWRLEFKTEMDSLNTRLKCMEQITAKKPFETSVQQRHNYRPTLKRGLRASRSTTHQRTEEAKTEKASRNIGSTPRKHVRQRPFVGKGAPTPRHRLSAVIKEVQREVQMRAEARAVVIERSAPSQASGGIV